MRVVVLHNQPSLSVDHPECASDQAVETAVEDVSGLLASAGFPVNQLGIGGDLLALEQEFSTCRPDVVFNLFEGFADRPESEVAVAQVLERSQVPFTGSPSQALRFALHKPLAKQCLRRARLPTPWSFVAEKLPIPDVAVPWPVIVKPARRDASEGIDQGSVVTTHHALASRVAELLDRYGSPVLIEQYIAGREFTVALLETPDLTPLPVAEVKFAPADDSTWPILTYAAKWLPGSPEYAASAMIHGVALPPPMSRRLVASASRAFRAIGCRDYARIDIRVTPDGGPFLLEVNANPDLSPTACFAGRTRSSRPGSWRSNGRIRAASRGSRESCPQRIQDSVRGVTMPQELPVLNLKAATYECTYGRGCDGICCREGRPLVYADEIQRIGEDLSKFLPLMRPAAAKVATRRGFLSGRKRLGQELMRVVGGWCIFFNEGCVLHRVGAEEGDKFRYKPAVCSLFPIQQDERDNWYIRQRGYKGERWDLFCLDPQNSTLPAAQTLQEELALAKRFDDEARPKDRDAP